MQENSILKDFEALFINNSRLERINLYLSKFNPIKTMRMERMEIRHSAILAWLLDPQETHGFRDAFLKGFIASALRGATKTNPTAPTALEVISSNLMSAEIRTEWRNIDILILVPDLRWVFIVENKFDSGLHSNQLDRYMEIVKKDFVDTNKYCEAGIFLNLWNEDPGDERYAPIPYSEVCKLLKVRLSSDSDKMPLEVSTFIKHYLEIIEEASGMNSEQNDVIKLARELYREHRRALEFITQTGSVTDFGSACESLFGDPSSYPSEVDIGECKFKVFNATSNRISLLPTSWISELEKKDGGKEWWGCQEWWAGYPLILWLELRKDEGKDSGKDSGKVTLFAEVGPVVPHEKRNQLIAKINTAPSKRIGFQKNAVSEGAKYSRFFKSNNAVVSDVTDPEQIKNAMKKLLMDFGVEINAVTEALKS